MPQQLSPESHSWYCKIDLDVGRAKLDLHGVIQTTQDVAHSQSLHPGPVGFGVRRHRDEVLLRRVPKRPGHWVQREVGLRHVEIVLSPVGDRLVADHVEPGGDLVNDPLEEALRRSLDFLKRVELMLEQLDCLLVVLLGDLRREIVMKILRLP